MRSGQHWRRLERRQSRVQNMENTRGSCGFARRMQQSELGFEE